jgi:hypothetical protein
MCQSSLCCMCIVDRITRTNLSSIPVLIWNGGEKIKLIFVSYHGYRIYYKHFGCWSWPFIHFQRRPFFRECPLWAQGTQIVPFFTKYKLQKKRKLGIDDIRKWWSKVYFGKFFDLIYDVIRCHHLGFMLSLSGCPQQPGLTTRAQLIKTNFVTILVLKLSWR